MALALLIGAVALLAPGLATASTGDIIAPQHPPAYTATDGWQAGLCARPAFSYLNLKAQNGKQLREKRLPLRVPACSRHSRRHRGG